MKPFVSTDPTAVTSQTLLPTHAQVGILASRWLLVLRLLQGFAIGGVSTGALVLIAQSLPAKRRGRWTGFPMVGGPAGSVRGDFSASNCSGRWVRDLGIGRFLTPPFLSPCPGGQTPVSTDGMGGFGSNLEACKHLLGARLRPVACR